MSTIQHKEFAWPVSPEWSERYLAGSFAELPAWDTGRQGDVAVAFDPEHPVLWHRAYALLRKSNETFAERTAALTHREVGQLMLHAASLSDEQRTKLAALAPDELLEQFKITHEDLAAWTPDPERAAEARVILQTLSDEEMGELKALEAHINLRSTADYLLGRDLAEFGIDYLDEARPQGFIPNCGCVMHSVDDLAAQREPMSNRKTRHAHYVHLCSRHAMLQAILGGKGSLAERLEDIHAIILRDNREDAARMEAQQAAAAA